MLFEEAAESPNSKNRKEIALKKLEGTDQNLERLADIVSEVGRQRDSLKRQANKASHYQTLKSEIMQLEGRLLKLDLQSGAEKLNLNQKQVASLELDQHAKERGAAGSRNPGGNNEIKITGARIINKTKSRGGQRTYVGL